MKKVIISIFAFCAVLAAVAAPNTNEAIGIRMVKEAYAKAQERAASEYTAKFNTKLSQIAPGVGLQDKNIDVFYTLDMDENGYSIQPYLVRCKYNIAARNCYEEYLYDEHGNRQFYYERSDSYKEDNAVEETRIYFNAEGDIFYSEVKTIVDGKVVKTEEFDSNSDYIMYIINQFESYKLITQKLAV